MKTIAAGILAMGLMMPGPASAQDHAPPESRPFAGGTLTITENEDYEKVLDFDGKELARNYYVAFDRTVDVAGVNVALVSIGDGGNMCSPYTLILWKPEGEELKSQPVGENDCGTPSPAVSAYSIYFVPYLSPGASGVVRVWTPDTGLEIAGDVTYAPQPGTSWKDFQPDKLGHILDSMKNADIYAASQKLLGDRLEDVVLGLMVGGGAEATASGIYYAKGCVPHDCGGNDGFMAIDPAKQKLYFARKGDEGIESWPAEKSWPKDLRQVMQEQIGGG